MAGMADRADRRDADLFDDICDHLLVIDTSLSGDPLQGVVGTYRLLRAAKNRFGATSEVRRFIGDGFPPLYQVSYMIGGMQLDALRAERIVHLMPPRPGGVLRRDSL